MEARDIKQQLEEAYKIVSESGIKEEVLQLQAFKYALQMGTHGATAHSAATPSHASNTSQSPHHQEAGLMGIAKSLGVPYDVIELFYDMVDEELTLNLPPKVLPDSASAAMREIAVLITVGRKHAGIGMSTSFDLIRVVCDDNGKLDKKNFAAAMSQMKPKLVPSGKGTNKELVPKRPADDLAKELILKYNSITG
jgi:hypothetical protein